MTNRVTEKVSTISTDIVAEREEQLKVLFPEAFTEGRVDFDKLRAALGDLSDDRPERYAFNWAGKRDSIRLLQKPSRATLEPCWEDSVEFDASRNLFIEGDNLEVLKLLHKPLFGQVKMIYIDPPYNTGNDFVYPDNFADPLQAYLQMTDQKDSEGNLLTSNAETSGRYHSAWLSMMYPRLFLARQLLRDDGVIFVSIDDHEVHNLRLLMNEIFGEENFVTTIIWEKRYSPQNAVQWFSEAHDFILIYAKNKETWQPNLLERSDEMDARYKNPDHDPRGNWKPADATAQAGHGTPSQFYTLTTPNGKTFEAPKGRCWVYTKERMEEMIADNRVWFGNTGNNVPAIKRFLTEVKQGVASQTIWKYEDVGHNQEAKKEVKTLFPETVPFDTPKPTRLISRIVELSTNQNSDDIILDFFAGSGTTAQAVLELNREDGGNRRFICVQLQEPTGNPQFPTIAEIGKERIRRVIARMKENPQGKLDLESRESPEDLGFKVFQLTESNFRQWEKLPDNVEPDEYARQMELFNDRFLEGWTAEDVIYEVALKEGYSLTSRIEPLKSTFDAAIWRVTDEDKEQHFYICLDETISLEAVKDLKLTRDDLFICRGIALDDTAAANLALQCRLKTL